MAKPKNLPPNTTPYHKIVKATEEFASFAEAMREHATRTQAERDGRERDRATHTTYAVAEEAKEQGS